MTAAHATADDPVLDAHEGLHGRAPARGAEKIDWAAHAPAVAEPSLIAHTCCCRAREYELWAGGGVRWIKRSDRAENGRVTCAWTRGRCAPINELWAAIVHGAAH